MRRPTAIETFCGLGFLLLSFGCKQRVPEQPTAEVANVAAPIKTAAQPETKPVVDLEKLLCGDRSPCEQKRVWSAGVDDKNRPMQVVKLSLNPDKNQQPELRNEGAEEVTESGGEECEPFEYWFVSDAKPALLLAVCNDGYGMAGMGSDTVTVTPGRFSHFQAGGSASMWNTGSVVALPSLQIIETSDGSWHRALPEAKDSTWNWPEFAGYVHGYNAGCNEDADVSRDTIDKGNFAYEPIPQPSVSDEYRQDGWKNAPLGSCSARVTSLGKQQPKGFNSGFVIHGKPGAESDASFKVVMPFATDMFVEVKDDVWVEEADSILRVDHLELWASTGTECPKPLKNLFQWGITLDGSVQTLYGKPDASPSVEVVRVNEGDALQSVRFKITLPGEYESLTVVYSDSDDGKTQKRLIATSALKQRDQFTLGEWKSIGAHEGRCEVKDGALAFIRIPQTPKSPVLGSDE